MAIIKNILSSEELILQNEYTIGRGNNNLCCIMQEDVSRRHAVIFWENGSWNLTDFSSNGTNVNSTHLHQKTIKLVENDIIQFSSSENEKWSFINSDKPRSFFKAISLENKFIDCGVGVLTIDGNESNYSFFKNKQQKWVFDDGNINKVLTNRNRYFIDDIEYEFIENECLVDTKINTDITKNARFEILVSIDEENVSSRIIINDLVIDLGERVYNHLLLLLIREKQLDIESGIDKQSSGWVHMENISDSLSRELLKDIDNYYINVLIHRLRKHLMNIHPYGYLFTSIIERKKGKLRFEMEHFEIKNGEDFVD